MLNFLVFVTRMTQYRATKTIRRNTPESEPDPMTVQTTTQAPISLPEGGKRDLRTQFAALCYRVVKGKVEILLVTSRRSKRWIIPKGWPMDGRTPGESALIEAWEEAGVQGKVHDRCLGLFSYRKTVAPSRDLPCVAMVYPVRVKALSDKYPEAGERKRRWMRPKKAASLVEDPELAHLIRSFDPRQL